MNIDDVLTAVGVLVHLEIVPNQNSNNNKVLEPYIIDGEQYMTNANISLKKQSPPKTLAFQKKHIRNERTVTYFMASTLNLPPVAFYFLIDHCM